MGSRHENELDIRLRELMHFGDATNLITLISGTLSNRCKQDYCVGGERKLSGLQSPVRNLLLLPLLL